MPAAAVIPALIAYIKVVAVKKLVVGFRGVRSGLPQGTHWFVVLSGAVPHALDCACWFHVIFTLRKSECSKQAFAIVCVSMG